jgi:hypothetical protein
MPPQAEEGERGGGEAQAIAAPFVGAPPRPKVGVSLAVGAPPSSSPGSIAGGTGIDGQGVSSAERARLAIGANEQLKAVTGVDLAQIARSVSARLEAPGVPAQPVVSVQPRAPVR